MISRIGKYTVEAELGRGGFGQVYKAWDPDVRQSVAIKVLLAQGDPDLLKRFRQEVVTTASLHHKNIVTIYASGEEEGTPYLVMELLEGQTLSQILKERIPLSLPEKVRIMTEVADGLAFAHSRGVVHRDVKPANIMLLRDGSVKIMDFGIALASERTVSMTLDGFVLGTVPYMSPEQFTSDAKANEQTDIFSFGEVYYELLTGRHPFEPFLRDLSALRVAILTHDPAAVGQLVPGCPEALELLVHRSLAKEREFRYQKFEDLRLDSSAVLVDLQHERAAVILQEVPGLVAAGELQEARVKVREAQQLDPGNRQARHLLESIDHQLQEKINRERIVARLLDADKHLGERRFAEAVQTLETAARLDTANVAVQARLLDARAKLDAALQANRLVEEARSWQARGELPEALERLDRALSADPEHTEARRLHPRIAAQLDRLRSDHGRQQAFEAASQHLARKEFAEALAVLDRLEREQPAAAGIAERRREVEQARAEEERRARAERLNLALNKTREALQAGDLGLAGQMLAHLAAHFGSEPGAEEALSLLGDRLNALLRARDVSSYRQRADELLDRKSFSEAAALLEEGLRRYPDDPGLARQKASAEALADAHQRSESVAAVLDRARGLRAAGDLEPALAAVREARQRLGDEAALVALAYVLERELEQQRYAAGLKNLLETVRELMAAGKYAEAAERTAKAKDYAAEAEVVDLLLSARSAAAAEEELRRRRQSIEKCRTAVLRELDSRAWKKAQSELRRARAEFPEGNWDDLARRVEEGLREEELEESRRREYETGLAEAERQRRAGNLPVAEALLTGMIARAPDVRATQMFSAVRQQMAEEAAAAESVRRSLEQNHLAEAARQLKAARAKSGGNPRWAELEDEIRRREALQKEEEQRRRSQEIAAAVEQAAALSAAERLDDATAALRAAASRFPGEPRIAGLLRETEERLRQQEEERLRQQEEQRLRQQEDQRLRQREEERKRSQEITAAIEQAEALLAAERLEDAAAALRASDSRFPGEPRIAALLRAAEQRLREREVREVLARSEALLRDGRAQESADLLEGGYAAEPLVQDVLARARGELDRQRHRARMIALEEEAQRETGKRALRRLAGEAQAIATRYPADEEIAGIAARVRVRVEMPAAAPAAHFPWKLAMAGGGAAAAIAAVVLAGHVGRRPQPPPAAPVEARHQPPQPTAVPPQATPPAPPAETAPKPPEASAAPGSKQTTAPRIAPELPKAAVTTAPPKNAAPVAPVASPPPSPEEIERRDWERVRTATDPAQLRAFLQSHPSGQFAPQARTRMADLAWASVDPANVEAVRKFVRENPDNPHAPEAQRIVDQFDARARQEQAKQEQAKQEQAKQEQARLEQAKQDALKQQLMKQELARRTREDEARRQQIADVLSRLNTAFERNRPRDLRAIWPGVSQAFLDAMATPRTKMSLNIQESDIRLAPQADQATATGQLVINSNGATTVRRATLALRNTGGNWTVEAATVN